MKMKLKNEEVSLYVAHIRDSLYFKLQSWKWENVHKQQFLRIYIKEFQSFSLEELLKFNVHTRKRLNIPFLFEGVQWDKGVFLLFRYIPS